MVSTGAVLTGVTCRSTVATPVCAPVVGASVTRYVTVRFTAETLKSPFEYLTWRSARMYALAGACPVKDSTHGLPASVYGRYGCTVGGAGHPDALSVSPRLQPVVSCTEALAIASLS